ncbi:non-ribosomal peptide synthetase [Actinomycetes bacterium NPDC127524]
MGNLLEILDWNLSEYQDSVAIAESHRTVTYGQLNKLSNGYLRVLKAWGVKEHDIVAIEMDRSIEAIAAMIAIWRAGGAYTVINKDYPDTRKQLMREILSVEFTLDESLNVLPDSGELPEKPDHRSPEHLSYVIFTSGTTSLPKAVGIPDRAVIRLLGEKRLGLSPGKTISHISQLEFDASIIEIWGGLLSGMTLALLTKTEVLNVYTVEHRINQGIDIMWITSSLFNFWVDKKPEMFKKLSHVIVGGEQLSLSHVKKALQYTKVINGYGPTENTVFTTLDVMEGDADEIRIGTPIHGTCTYVVNEQGECSNEGELYVSGLGLALGYINNPEKTEESFVKWNGMDVYRTGDLVRLDRTGKIEYIGRRDTQVKINGYRIDLQELEYTVKFLGVENCHAFVKDKKVYLAITSSYEKLADDLKKHLPMYMIPSKIVEVETLALTANGKMDTRALYEEHFVPKSVKLTNVISKYLDSSQLEVHSNLFEFGLDSVTVWEISRDINETFHADLSFFDIIQNPSVHEILNVLGEKKYAANHL